MALTLFSHHFMRLTAIKFLVISILFVVLAGCVGTLPKPSDSNSSLIVLSIQAARTLGSNYPDVVNIVRKEDGKLIKHTAKNEKYYYFANLLPGTYQIDAAYLSIKGTSSSSTSGAVTTTFSMGSTNNFPFSDEIKNTTTVKLNAGNVVFMGDITAEGTSKMWPPGAIEFSNVKISKTGEGEKAAFDVLKRDYKDSLWVSRF